MRLICFKVHIKNNYLHITKSYDYMDQLKSQSTRFTMHGFYAIIPSYRSKKYESNRIIPQESE